MDVTVARRALEQKRREIEDELGVLTAVPRDPAGAVSFGKRIGEGTTEAVDRINRTGAAKLLDAMLSDVGRALVKLDEGTYGVCDRCGEPIAEARLEARPWSVLCVSDSETR